MTAVTHIYAYTTNHVSGSDTFHTKAKLSMTPSVCPHCTEKLCDCVFILKSVLDLLFRQTFHPHCSHTFWSSCFDPDSWQLGAVLFLCSTFLLCAVSGLRELLCFSSWNLTGYLPEYLQKSYFSFPFLVYFISLRCCLCLWGHKTINTSGKLQMCGEKNPTHLWWAETVKHFMTTDVRAIGL